MAYATDTRTHADVLGGDRFRALRASLADRWAKYKIYRQTLDELQTLNDRDLADLGIHRSEIARVARQAAYE